MGTSLSVSSVTLGVKLLTLTLSRHKPEHSAATGMHSSVGEGADFPPLRAKGAGREDIFLLCQIPTEHRNNLTQILSILTAGGTGLGCTNKVECLWILHTWSCTSRVSVGNGEHNELHA